MHYLSERSHVVIFEGTHKDSTVVHNVMELCEVGELFDRFVQKRHYSERQTMTLIKIIVEVVEPCFYKPDGCFFCSRFSICSFF